MNLTTAGCPNFQRNNITRTVTNTPYTIFLLTSCFISTDSLHSSEELDRTGLVFWWTAGRHVQDWSLETGDYLMAGHCLISPLSRPFLTPGQGRNWFCLWCSNGLHTNVRKVSINVLWSASSCCRESSATTALSAGLACQSGKSCLHYEQLVLWLSHNQSLSTGKIVRIMT